MNFNRLLKLPLDSKSSIFLFGPRGTGKTTWLRTHLPDALYLDLLEYPLYERLLLNPKELSAIIPENYTDWIIIDEVQRIPQLLNEVHRLIELRKYRFILTGSSARSLKKKGVNLLAGRALCYNMHPLVIQEMDGSFDLSKVLEFGLLPAAISHGDPHSYLHAYTHTYIKEEVAQEGFSRDIASYTKFLQTATFSQAQLLNIAEISREVGVSRPTITTYFDILEAMLLAVFLQPFTKRAKRKMVTHNKFFFFDVGIYNALRPKGPFDTQQEVDGAGLETLFLQTVRALNDYLELGYEIFFWRTSAGEEVDFILYGKSGFHAFEIKRSKKISSNDLKHLKKFHEDYPEAKLHVLYGGDLHEYHGPITVYPFIEGLKALTKILYI
jgi:predicted AAA+ superfamily ATPase